MTPPAPRAQGLAVDGRSPTSTPILEIPHAHRDLVACLPACIGGTAIGDDGSVPASVVAAVEALSQP